MGRLLGYFARGLVLVTPIAVTIWVCWLVFIRVDGWLGLPIQGAGFVATIVLITLIGFLGTNLLTRSAVGLFERAMARLPFVRLLYGSTKDLLNAFVGEKRRFDKPVMVSLNASGTTRMVGFVTQESMHHLGLEGFVAVYCPHSYAFSGHVFILPASHVSPIDVASADAMAFIVSGGVSALVLAAQSTGEYAAVSKP